MTTQATHDSWLAAGLVSTEIDAAPPELASAGAQHSNTVMSLGITDAGAVSTIDFDANWRVWHADDLRPIAAGRIPSRYGRGIAIDPTGTTLAVLASEQRTHYTFDAWLVDIETGVARLLRADVATRCAWTTDGRLVLTSAAGYRIYARTGEVLDAYQPRDGWWAAVASVAGDRIYYIRHGELRCLRVGDRTSLPAPDVGPYAAPPGHSHGWSPEALTLSRDGTVLTIGDRSEVFIWHTSRLELLARLRLRGPRLVGTKVRFDHCASKLVASFEHVLEPGAAQLTHVVYDGALGRVTHVLTMPRHFHALKGHAELPLGGRALLVAHADALQHFSLT